MNEPTKTTYIIIFLIFAGLFGGGLLTGSGCDYFQKRNFIDKTDRTGTLYELCTKAQKAEKSGAGENLMLCQKLLTELTISGKLEIFKNCVDWQRANKDKLKQYPEFDCYEIVYYK
jgi:hypothetical protein